MTTTDNAMLSAIAADLDDDTRRLAYADWLDESGDSDRAELIRVQCEIESVRRECRCGSCVGRRGGGQHHNGPCGIDRRNEQGVKPRNRERELIAAHPEWTQWPCPACHPRNCGLVVMWTPSSGYYTLCPCLVCGAACDLLKINNGEVRDDEYAIAQRRITWDRGWPGWVHVERMSELVVTEVQRTQYETGPFHTDEHTRPTPLLTALAITPPWGVPLRGVIVEELRPQKGSDGWWVWREYVNNSSLPSKVFDHLPDKPNIRGLSGAWYSTEQAAIRAAAAAFLEFGRKHK